MKYKIKDYFENDCYYIEICVPSINKTFQGKCRLHEEDKKEVLRYRGYIIAENRAWIKWLSYLKQEINIKKKTLEDFMGSYSSSSNYDATNYIARKLRKQVYIYLKEINSINGEIEELRQQIVNLIYPKVKNNKSDY